MKVTYSIDFHIPMKDVANPQEYPVETDHVLTVRELLTLLAERFSSVRLLMSFGGGKRPPLAVLVKGRMLEPDDLIPDGAQVRLIGAVAGG